MKKQMTVRKNSFGSIISCNWTDSSIYYHADPGNRKDALSDAHSGITVWIYSRRTVWPDRWIYYTIT